MKILVADDDRIARKVLRAFLEEAGYEIVVAEDGRQAIDILSGENAPLIVILDWVMPGMSGPEVCAKLRTSSLGFRPYVLMLSAKTEKTEVVAGLDAGADDFLSKPFNLAELLARLRVARRMVEYEIELRRKLAELAALQERHQLLGELIVTPSTQDAGGSAPTDESPSGKPQFSTEQLGTLASVALEQLGLGEVQPVPAPIGFQANRVAYAAWVAIIAIDTQRWFDLMIEIESPVVASLMEKTLHRRSGTNTPKHVFVAEALTIISSAVRSEFRQRTFDTLMPYLSRGVYLERPRLTPPLPDDAAPIHLDLAGHHLQLTIVEQEAPFRRKTSTQLRLHDVLAEAYPPPNVNEVPLLNRGAILNDRFIQKLATFAEATSEQHPIPVYVPTPLAAFFNREATT